MLDVFNLQFYFSMLFILAINVPIFFWVIRPLKDILAV